MLVSSIFSFFPQCFLLYVVQIPQFEPRLNFLSANVFNFDKSPFSSLGRVNFTFVRHYVVWQPFPPYILILTYWRKNVLGKHCKNVKLLILSNFTFLHNVFYVICNLKSFNSHISVVICSFFEYGAVSKWYIREWINLTRLNIPMDAMDPLSDCTFCAVGENKHKVFNVVGKSLWFCTWRWHG